MDVFQYKLKFDLCTLLLAASAIGLNVLNSVLNFLKFYTVDLR